MKNKYNWNLETLLQNKSLEALYKQWFDLCTKQCNLVNSFYKTKPNFVKWLKLDLECEKVSNRLANYISNHNEENLADPQWSGLIQKLSFDANEFAKKLYVYTNLALKNEDKIKSYLKDPKLKAWNREFDLLFKEKKHTLDDKSEALLAKLSADSGAVGDVYSVLTDSDLKYADAIDKNNKHHKIATVADVTKLLKQKDRVLRKSAWISYNTAFDSIKNTITKTLYYNYLRANTWAKVRNYEDYIDSTLVNDEVDRQLLLSIYKNVESYKDTFVKFKKARQAIIKKIYKIKELEPWDLSLDLISKPVKYSVESAQKEVKCALAPLGKEYISVIDKAFNENWISWLPAKGKRSGAYSIGGTYGLDKFYILMNFDETSDSVSTIAHELGHSVNSYYINKYQDIYADVDMFVAEIASIVNEMLLNFYWLKKYKDDKQMKIHIYENMLSTFFACTSRQITFSKFEYDANQMINEGKPFTVADVEKLYMDARKKYEGVSAKAEADTKKHPYNLANTAILKVHHFYMNSFYVYKYAIGQIIALVVADRIFNKDEKMLNNYYKFLSVGCSIPPLEIIKILDLDLHKPEVYKQAKDIVNKLVKEFVKLSK